MTTKGPNLWRQAVVRLLAGVALQMRHCISAACKRLSRTLVGLIILYGGSDGFLHVVLVFFTNSGSTNAII